ncbi:MAG: ATP-binding protein [Bdellovibrio sp.]|nr:ATP-binding protein [Bdellovibrio sp.]
MFARMLKPPERSFFLFGPRATGKSTWLKNNLQNNFTFDLLKNEIYFQLLRSPVFFREQVLAQDKKKWIVIDEVQRIPGLLNEVHSLIEDGYRFALTGSSARKVKRGQANLLAGRAILLNFYPLIYDEYGKTVAIDKILAHGSLPHVLSNPQDRIQILEAYTGTYLREEIKEEALTRNIESFGRFLEVAALANAQVTNLSNISRDASVSRATVSTYFDILQDTLIGRMLPAWQPKAKMKEVAHPKFYFFDCGVLRAIQGRLRDPVADGERGHLLETLLIHEVGAFISYCNLGGKLSYWRISDEIEVDLIWQRGKRLVALECKSSSKWRPEYNKGFKSLMDSSIKPEKCIGVYLGKETLKKEWGIIYPFDIFLSKLKEIF